MPLIAFDTLAYSDKLQEGGLPREQAEAIARANVDAFRSLVVTQRLATKRDIEELRQATKRDTSELRQELKEDISELRQEMADTKHEILKWLFGLIIALGAAIMAYMSYFLK